MDRQIHQSHGSSGIELLQTPRVFLPQKMPSQLCLNVNSPLSTLTRTKTHCLPGITSPYPPPKWGHFWTSSSIGEFTSFANSWVFESFVWHPNVLILKLLGQCPIKNIHGSPEKLDSLFPKTSYSCWSIWAVLHFNEVHMSKKTRLPRPA